METLPPLFVESVTKDRHFNTAFFVTLLCMLGWAVLGMTANYVFQMTILRPLHKRIFRRFRIKYMPPPPAEDLSRSVPITPPHPSAGVASDELPPSAPAAKKTS